MDREVKRAEDEAKVRFAIEEMVLTLKGMGEDSPFEWVARMHELIALSMATLERYTRPIPIVPQVEDPERYRPG